MIVTDFTKRALVTRRERRDLPKEGWQLVSNSLLLELGAGCKWNHVYIDVRISDDGKFLWVKTAKQG